MPQIAAIMPMLGAAGGTAAGTAAAGGAAGTAAGGAAGSGLIGAMGLGAGSAGASAIGSGLPVMGGALGMGLGSMLSGGGRQPLSPMSQPSLPPPPQIRQALSRDPTYGLTRSKPDEALEAAIMALLQRR